MEVTMTKYIDAEKLIALLEQRKKQLARWTDKEYANQRIDEIDCILDVDIDSLQQDKESVELELCSQTWWEERGWIMIPPDATIEGIDSLLKQVRKKLQQEQPDVDLAEEIKNYFKGFYMDLTDQGYILKNSDGSVGLMSVKEIARHFYELGLKAKSATHG